jgi:hypothetical protein
MNTLRQAVQEYLSMRRSLGFKLRDAGKLLLAFVKFMEQCRASYIRFCSPMPEARVSAPTACITCWSVMSKLPPRSVRR